MGNIYHYLSDIQTNRLTIQISDDITNKDNGILSNIAFVMQFRLFDDDYEEVQPLLMSDYTPVKQPPREVGMNRFY